MAHRAGVAIAIMREVRTLISYCTGELALHGACLLAYRANAHISVHVVARAGAAALACHVAGALAT